MNKTQNDLSYDEAKLDYQALLATSRIAVGHCTEEIYKHLSNLRAIPPNKPRPSSAEWLLREANQLAVAAETMYTLEEGLQRSNIIIVNKD